jgi:hypothetical protein
VDGDRGQPPEAARIERDVQAEQQLSPGGVAGVFDDLVTDGVDAAADDAGELLGVVVVERGDLLVAALVGGHGLALLGARCGPGLHGAGPFWSSARFPGR